MTRICVLTSVHPAFDTRVFHKECRSLVHAGYEVILVVPHEKDDLVAGVQVKALPEPAGRVSRITRTVWQVYREAIRLKADLYHFHDPELIAVGLLLRLGLRKVIYDVHEDVPRQILTKHYLPWIVRQPVAWVMRCMEWLGGLAFNAVVAATPKIANRFPARKTVTVHNYPITAELLYPSPISYKERPHSFVYVGVIAEVRGAVEMARAISQIPGAWLDLAGPYSPPSFADTFQALARGSSVNYHGELSRMQVAQLFASARAGLVLHHPVPNEIDALPIKLFEYMSAGLPVIASDFPALKPIIQETGCGLLVDPLMPEAIAEAMRWILDHPSEAEAMGRRGRQAVERTYNWEAESTKIIGLYSKLLAS